MNSHILNAVLLLVSTNSEIELGFELPIELDSKYTFLKTWNSLLNNNGILNYSLISWSFRSPKHCRVTLKNTNHPAIAYGKTLRLTSLPNVKTECLILNINFQLPFLI